MKCFRCNENDTELGKMLCVACVPPIPVKSVEPHKRAIYTHLCICGSCGTEVFRKEHVVRRTARNEQQARLALFKHIAKVRHTGKIWPEQIWINEESGDDGFEVAATGEKCPTHLQASNVLPVFKGQRRAGIEGKWIASVEPERDTDSE